MINPNIDLNDPWLLGLAEAELRRVLACAAGGKVSVDASTRTRPYMQTQYTDDVAANASGTWEFLFDDADTLVLGAQASVRGAVVTVSDDSTPDGVDTYASIPTRILEDAADWIEVKLSSTDGNVAMEDYVPLSHLAAAFADLRPWVNHGTRLTVAWRAPAQFAADRVQLSLVTRKFT